MERKTRKIKKLRYLAPEYVSEPHRFLKDIVHGWGTNWSLNFGFLFSYSMCPMLDRNRVFDYGFTYLHLAQMIEAAYTILKRRNWQPTAKKKLFQYKDFGELSALLLDKEKIDAQRIICDFFGFMSLRDWYDFLDELLLSSDINNKRKQGYEIEQELLIAREFILLLPDALLQIYKDRVVYINPQS